MLEVKALEICRAKSQQSWDSENLFCTWTSGAGLTKVLFTTDTFPIPRPHSTTTLWLWMQEGTEEHLDVTAHELRPAASLNSYCLSWTFAAAVKTQNLLISFFGWNTAALELLRQEKHLLFFSSESWCIFCVPQSYIKSHGNQFKHCILLGTKDRQTKKKKTKETPKQFNAFHFVLTSSLCWWFT